MRATRCCFGRHSIQRYTGPSNRGRDASLLRNRWCYMCRRRCPPTPGRYVSSMIVRFVRSAPCYPRRRSCGRDFAARPGDRFEATRTNRSADRRCYKSLFLLRSQSVLPTSLPIWSTSWTFPTMTSGPGTRFGAAGPIACGIGGMTIDFVSPLTSWSIWIGCIAAPTEIFPTIAPASDGRPSALANSLETSSRPFVMASDCAAGL